MEEDSDFTDIPVVIPFDLNWKWEYTEIEFLLDKISQLVPEMRALGHPVWVEFIEDTDFKSHLEKYNPQEVVVFNLCEELPGIPHSCGQAAEVVESMGFTHTGASARAIYLNQDKSKVKRLLKQHGVPTPEWHLYHTSRLNGWKQYPAIVKPALEHCSIGLSPESVVTNRVELKRQLEYVIDTFHQNVLVEDFVDGREFRVSVWGNHPARMLPPAEMDYSRFNNIKERLLSYESKMDPDSIYYQEIKLIQPVDLSPTELAAMEKVAADSYRIAGCRDYGGIDLRLRDGIFYALDVNCDPEINPHNSLTFGAKMMGYSFGQQGSHIVNMAARRHPVFKKRFKDVS